MNTSKIIKGVVGGGRYTVTAPIIKEDYGLYLQIEGIELPETYEVDFSNDEHSGSSVTMIGNSDGVLIPSQFIKSGKVDIEMFVGMQKETGCMDSCGDCIAKEYCRKLIEPEEVVEE